MTKKSGKTILSCTTWLVNEFFSSSHFDAIKTFKYWFPQNRCFYKQRNFFKMMLEFRKDWKDLAFVGRYNLLNGRFLHHLWTKVSQFNVPLMMSAPQFSSKMLKNLKEQGFCTKVLLAQRQLSEVFSCKNKLWSFCELPAWWKTSQTPLLTKVRDFERSAASKTWKCKLYSFFHTLPWWKLFIFIFW